MKNLVIVLFALSLFPLNAQKIAVEIGPEVKITNSTRFWGHLNSDAAAHYVMLMNETSSLFSLGKTTPILQKYDRKFNLIFEKEIKVDSGDDIVFENMLYSKNSFLMCSSKWEKKEERYFFYATPINMQGKASRPQKIATIAYDGKDNMPNTINFLMSSDTSKLLNAVVADHNEDDINAKISLTVTDNQLNKIWSKGFEMPYSQEQITVRNWSLTNEGKVFMIAKVYDERRRKETKTKEGKRYPAYRMIVFRFDGESDKPKEYILGLGDKFVTDIAIKLSPTNDLNVAGFYANDKRGVAQGVFYTRINGQSGNSEIATQKEFSANDIANLDTEKDRSGDKGLDSNFEFKEIVLREDGSLIVTAEEAYSYTYTTRQGNSYTTRTVYINNEIFVTSIGSDGKIEWTQVIPKKQSFTNTRMFNGFATMISNGNVYFLYNDDEDNIKKPLTAKAKRISSFSDAVAGLVTINRDGTTKRTAAFNSKEDANALLVTSNSAQISPNELFFVTTKFSFLSKTKIRMGLVRVP